MFRNIYRARTWLFSSFVVSFDLGATVIGITVTVGIVERGLEDRRTGEVRVRRDGDVRVDLLGALSVSTSVLAAVPRRVMLDVVAVVVGLPTLEVEVVVPVSEPEAAVVWRPRVRRRAGCTFIV